MLVTVRRLVLPFKPSFVAISRFRSATSKPISRRAFVCMKRFPFEIVTGTICRNILRVEDLLKLLCWTPLVFKGMSSCNNVWCCLLQLLTRHQTSDSPFFKMWPLARQFRHSFSSSTNLSFSVKNFALNWSQDVILCYIIQSYGIISILIRFVTG